MNLEGLMNFRTKLYEIQKDIYLKILDTSLLIELFIMAEKSEVPNKYLQEKLNIKTERMTDLLNGSKITKEEAKRILDFISRAVVPDLKTQAKIYAKNICEHLGTGSASKALDVSMRTLQRQIYD